jgi:hypothetical protein
MYIGQYCGRGGVREFFGKIFFENLVFTCIIYLQLARFVLFAYVLLNGC